MDEKKVRIALALSGVAIVAYSVGYQKATTRTIQQLGDATTKEALIYLATQDHIRSRFGR